MAISPDPLLSVVITTYNRGAVLTRALRTLIAQTEQKWDAIVIGDACSDDTQAQVAALGDDRIRFVNLPNRFGEQAGPNSVGMALARAPYVAFLNHDDYWLEQHLALALNDLNETGADIYWSRAASFTNRGAWPDRVFFDTVSPKGRALADIFHSKPNLAEPMSAWVVRKDALDRLGPMTLASQILQAPIVDYCQRASQLGFRLHASDVITVLKDRFWAPPPSYENTAQYAENMVVQIETGQAEKLMQTIEQDLWLSHALQGSNPREMSPRTTGQSSRADVSRLAGLNLAEMERSARSEPARLLTSVLTRRTGEIVHDQPELSEMIAFARAALK